LKVAYRKNPMPSCEQRVTWLHALLKLMVKNRDLIADTISQDFGNRSYYESQFSEVFTLVSSLRHTKSKLARWMRPQAREVLLPMRPGRAQIIYQPLGVVGVIAPWNYPFQLAIGPLAAALAAGNRVMIKPSEYTPRSSALLAQLLSEALPSDVVRVVTGGPELGVAFSRLPFDHLLFTGSSAVGRKIMAAAAENLTPVTLELGGKSPALIHDSFSLERAAERVVAGKWWNAGQTCIAPDYALVPSAKLEQFVDALKKHLTRTYPTLADNADYTSIIDERHLQRLRELVVDAQQRGARAIEVNPAGEQLSAHGRKFAPTLLVGVHDQMRVMQEEVFGPVLPIVGYGSLQEAVEYINSRSRPLALYYFDSDRERVASVLSQTVSGGVTVNDTLLHSAVDDLPFGGVGESGTGAYHGFDGFATFSHKKAVYYQTRFNIGGLKDPPYLPRVRKLLDFLIGK
jgi:coniferyl-aldehyde dehydrogenase